MKKKILVFGAGDNQTLLIKACRHLGYYTIATDPNPQAPGADFADLFVPLAPKDAEAHRELIRQAGVQGIVSCQMENPLSLMAELAQEFGFPFPTPEVIRRARNKFLMKQAFREAGVPCAKGILVDNCEGLAQLDLSGFQFPLIIKPVDSYSSRGVFRVDTQEQLICFCRETSRFSSTGQVLVEEFLEGPEVSVESVTYRGKTEVIQITDKTITPYPHTVELAHAQPSALPSDICAQIADITQRAIAAIGIDNSGSHAELIITKDGPKMVEIGSRLGGDYISSYLTLLSTGVDMNRAVAQIAMGETPDLEKTVARASGIQYINWAPGLRIERMDGFGAFMQMPGIDYAGILINQGEVLPEITDSAKRHAFFITSAENRTELAKNIGRLSTALSCCVVLNDPNAEPVLARSENAQSSTSLLHPA
jgi:biotin carboxylase